MRARVERHRRLHVPALQRNVGLLLQTLSVRVHRARHVHDDVILKLIEEVGTLKNKFFASAVLSEPLLLLLLLP